MELEESLAEVELLKLQSDQKHVQMYRSFTFMNQDQLGSRARRRLDNCVQDLIVWSFPAEAGKERGDTNHGALVQEIVMNRLYIYQWCYGFHNFNYVYIYGILPK